MVRFFSFCLYIYSTIRVWDLETGHCSAHIRVQDEAKEEKTLVWSLQVLADNTIVSGDSLGRTQFWNADFQTLRCSVRAHDGDVLAVVAQVLYHKIYRYKYIYI